MTARAARAAALLSAALCQALCLVLLAGCGGWAPNGLHTGGRTVHLTYALWDPNEQVGYQKSIDEFERAHPNIRVTIELVPYPTFQAKLTSEFISHNGPDLYWVNTPFLAQFIADGVAMDLTSRIRADHVDLGAYHPALVGLHRHDGRIYGLPKDWDTIAIYYNADYFAKHHITVPSPLTWSPDGSGSFDRLLAAATTDTHGRTAAQPGFDRAHVATYGIGIANDPQGGYGSYLAMTGNSVILPHPYASQVSLAGGTDTFQYLIDLMNRRGLAAPAAEMGPNGDGSAAQQLFARGEIAMFQTGDWNTTPISQSVKFHVGVLPLPTGPQGRSTVFNGLVDAVNAHTPHPDEAWQLEKWLGSRESQRILGQGGYVWPAITDLDPLFLNYWKHKSIDLTPFLAESQGQVVNFPVAPGMGEALTDVASALGPAWLGQAPVPDALRQATAVANHDLATATY